ncbi:MAG: helix-turn-helix domain-containing protein, partial [Candidatus Omnitrophica bacterium]|nr:helix-turn-helix domain-containing protein [Candidatus Omnitrophota bacterium]
MNDIRRKRFIQRIKKKEKRLPTKKEIEALKLITVDRVKKIAKLESSSFFSLDAPPAGSQNEIYFKESIEDENAESPSKQAEGMILDEISQILTKREYKVMEIRFGLKDGVSHSREHIAREFNMTTENVRLILKEIFRKLRFRLKNRTKLLAYLERQKEKLRNSSEEDTRTDVVEKKVSEENIGRLSAKIHELETVAHDPNILNPESMLLQSADVLEEILKEMAIFKTILLVEISIIMSQYLTKYSLTMEKAAKQTGISVTMISNIFNKNYNSISYKYLDKIINGFQMDSEIVKRARRNISGLQYAYKRGMYVYYHFLSREKIQKIDLDKIATLSQLSRSLITIRFKQGRFLKEESYGKQQKNDLSKMKAIAKSMYDLANGKEVEEKTGRSGVRTTEGYLVVEIFGRILKVSKIGGVRAEIQKMLLSGEDIVWTAEDVDVLADIYSENIYLYWLIFQTQGMSEKETKARVLDHLEPVLDKDGRKEKIQELLVELKTRRQKTKRNKGPPKGLIAWFIGLILLGLSFNAHAQTRAVNKNGIEMWTPDTYSEEITDDEYESNHSDSKAQRRYHVGRRAFYTEKDEKGDWFLMVDGRPFVVKAVTYSPTPVGQSPDKGTMTSWTDEDSNYNKKADGPFDAWVDENRNGRRDPQERRVGDFRIMRDMGVNAIRIFHHPQALDKRVLRKLYQDYGIRVIMGDFLGQYTLGSGAQWSEGTDYSDPQQRENMLRSVEKMVREHRNEPYILMWVLGNENNYQPNVQDNPEAYYEFVNEAAALIKSLDHKHPVAISNGDLQFIKILAKNKSNIDIFMPNAYRGGFGFGALWQSAKNHLDMPVLIGEYGKSAISGEDAQVNSHRRNWINIERNSGGYSSGQGNAIGGVAFEYLDEWWKAKKEDKHNGQGDQTGVPPGEEWFGIFGQGDGTQSPFLRDPRKVYYLYKNKLWNDNPRKRHQEEYQDDDKLSFKEEFLKLFEFVGTAEAFTNDDISAVQISLKDKSRSYNGKEREGALAAELIAFPHEPISFDEGIRSHYNDDGDFVLSVQKWNSRMDINLTKKIVIYYSDSFYDSAKTQMALLAYLKSDY